MLSPEAQRAWTGLAIGAGGVLTIVAYTRYNRAARRRGSRAHWAGGLALAILGMGGQGVGWWLLCTAGPSFRSPLLTSAGIAICLGALAVYLAAARWVGRWRSPSRYSLALNRGGIYAHVRHPQAFSLCLVVVGLVFLGATVPYLLSAPLWLGFWIGYTWLEERWELIPAFGADYLRYMQETPRLVPLRLRRRGRKRPGDRGPNQHS